MGDPDVETEGDVDALLVADTVGVPDTLIDTVGEEEDEEDVLTVGLVDDVVEPVVDTVTVGDTV